MEELKGKTVYMILHNYWHLEYSIVRIMANLNEAYDFICNREDNALNTIYNFKKLITVSTDEDIKNEVTDDGLYICCISSDKYKKISLLDFDNVSSYIIVPKTIC